MKGAQPEGQDVDPSKGRAISYPERATEMQSQAENRVMKVHKPALIFLHRSLFFSQLIYKQIRKAHLKQAKGLQAKHME